MKRKPDHEISSGNIFADLGFKHPKRELRRAKRALALWRKTMTEVIHLRCDNCGDEASSDDNLRRPKGWVYVGRELEHFHYCPECWGRMTTRLGKLPPTRGEP